MIPQLNISFRFVIQHIVQTLLDNSLIFRVQLDNLSSMRQTFIILFDNKLGYQQINTNQHSFSAAALIERLLHADRDSDVTWHACYLVVDKLYYMTHYLFIKSCTFCCLCFSWWCFVEMFCFTKICIKDGIVFFIVCFGVNLCRAASFLEEAHRQPIPSSPSFANSPSYGEFIAYWKLNTGRVLNIPLPHYLTHVRLWVPFNSQTKYWCCQ